MTAHWAHCSQKVFEAKIIYALQRLEIQKVCVCCVPQQHIEEHQENYMVETLNFLTQYKEDGNYLLEQTITSNES